MSQDLLQLRCLELGGVCGERFGRGDPKGFAWGWACVVGDVSPDGSSLLVRALEPSALWTVGVPGGAAHFITKVEGTWQQRFSPDGKYIAYSDERKGQEGLYVMGRDGADVRKLVTMKATNPLRPCLVTRWWPNPLHES